MVKNSSIAKEKRINVLHDLIKLDVDLAQNLVLVDISTKDLISLVNKLKHNKNFNKKLENIIK